MRVLTIFVRTGTAKYASAESELAAMFRAQVPGVERRTIVVDTALPPGEAERQDDRVVIGGDNSVREFSGFDTGIRWAADELCQYDLVNLTTSAFRQLYSDYLERFQPPVLASIVGRAACVGHIDCYNEPVEVCGCISQHWLRTACLFIPPTELRLLGTMVSVRDREEWFSGDPAAPFRSNAPLSDRYKRFITDWLTGNDIGQGVTWHTRLSLDEDSLPEFERKAMAILNEHLFGVRLRAAACRTIDVTWLSGRLMQSRPEDIAWTTPWWKQLADRDRHPLRIGPAVLASQ